MSRSSYTTRSAKFAAAARRKRTLVQKPPMRTLDFHDLVQFSAAKKGPVNRIDIRQSAQKLVNVNVHLKELGKGLYGLSEAFRQKCSWFLTSLEKAYETAIGVRITAEERDAVRKLEEILNNEEANNEEAPAVQPVFESDSEQAEELTIELPDIEPLTWSEDFYEIEESPESGEPDGQATRQLPLASQGVRENSFSDIQIGALTELSDIPADAVATDAQTAQVTGIQVTDAQATDIQVTDAQATGTQATDAQATVPGGPATGTPLDDSSGVIEVPSVCDVPFDISPLEGPDEDELRAELIGDPVQDFPPVPEGSLFVEDAPNASPHEDLISERQEPGFVRDQSTPQHLDVSGLSMPEIAPSEISLAEETANTTDNCAVSLRDANFREAFSEIAEEENIYQSFRSVVGRRAKRRQSQRQPRFDLDTMGAPCIDTRILQNFDEAPELDSTAFKLGAESGVEPGAEPGAEPDSADMFSIDMTIRAADSHRELSISDIDFRPAAIGEIQSLSHLGEISYSSSQEAEVDNGLDFDGGFDDPNPDLFSPHQSDDSRAHSFHPFITSADLEIIETRVAKCIATGAVSFDVVAAELLQEFTDYTVPDYFGVLIALANQKRLKVIQEKAAPHVPIMISSYN